MDQKKTNTRFFLHLFLRHTTRADNKAHKVVIRILLDRNVQFLTPPDRYGLNGLKGNGLVRNENSKYENERAQRKFE